MEELHMNNEQLINKIKAGEYRDSLKAVLLMSEYALQNNNSFMRAFSNEYTYEINKTYVDHVAIENMDAFSAEFVEYLDGGCMPF